MSTGFFFHHPNPPNLNHLFTKFQEKVKELMLTVLHHRQMLGRWISGWNFPEIQTGCCNTCGESPVNPTSPVNLQIFWDGFFVSGFRQTKKSHRNGRKTWSKGSRHCWGDILGRWNNWFLVFGSTLMWTNHLKHFHSAGWRDPAMGRPAGNGNCPTVQTLGPQKISSLCALYLYLVHGVWT